MEVTELVEVEVEVLVLDPESRPVQIFSFDKSRWDN